MSFILHLDKHLSAMIETHGQTTYAILFAIVFAETGLVLTPFLPGDSLLFAAGAFAGERAWAFLLRRFLPPSCTSSLVSAPTGRALYADASSNKRRALHVCVRTQAWASWTWRRSWWCSW